ncbi:MAG: glycosyltransferase family 1 protein [Anaerolineae bacterium]
MSALIGIDYTSAVHQRAGIGRYTRELVKALADAPTGGWSAAYRLFVANSGARAAQSLPGERFGWRTTRLSERWLARLWYRLALPLPVELWTGRLNLFHAADFFLPPTRPATRTLVTVHDLSFVRYPDSTMPGMSRQLNNWVPRSVARADHVIAVSQATANDLTELYGTAPGKISVLHHGVSPEFRPVTDAAQQQAVRQKYGLGERPFILSLGTIQPRKNYRRLVQAFAQLKADATLVIIGGAGWNSQAVFDEVARLGLTERVIFPGFAADADLPALYSAATLFVYPSLYEGFGLPALEAMACGTPVVASGTSALPEVVGEAGLLVEPTDVAALAHALNTLLHDDEQRRRLSAAGLARAASFTWPGMAARLVQVYQHLTA